jgi:CubicO group peptidase (beta-lactamase class C family)
MHLTARLAVLLTSLVFFPLGSNCQGAEPASPPTGVESDPKIAELLEPIRERHKIPALVAALVRGEHPTRLAAVGLRKAGSPEAIMANDQLHLGSCTKSMTATLLALLVDEKRLTWQSTIGDVFTEEMPRLHPAYRAATLEQLLTHRAGLPANVLWSQLAAGTPMEQRDLLLREGLDKPPVHAPGTKFLYSNVGYVLAGHMAEKITGKSWEDLLRERLFKPLEMSSAGFGPPGTKDRVEQPWGHALFLGKPIPSQNDNPPVLGPAGTVHCSILDWSRFATLHLEGARGGGRLLKPESFLALHTPPKGEEYAGGWGAIERPWAKGRVLTHSGSNTFWYSTVWIAPERNLALLAVANQGGEAGAKACDDAVTALVRLVVEPR